MATYQDGLILWGDDPENAAYWDFVANTTGPMLADFEAKVVACAAAKCSGHGRCTSVPVEALFTCSAGNECVPSATAGSGVPKIECKGACGPLAKGYYRCTGGSCVPSLQGVSAGECVKMCGGGESEHSVTEEVVCECRHPWAGPSCATKTVSE